MTGPSSWRNLHDVQSAQRSEAWSELLGLRSNPRTTPGASYSGGLFSSPTGFSPSQPTGGRFPPEGNLFPDSQERYTPRSTQAEEPGSCTPSSMERRGRKFLDSAFAAVPTSFSDKQPLTRPKSGLRALDPLFDTMEGSPRHSSVHDLRSMDPLFSTLDSSTNASSQSLEPLFENANGGCQASVMGRKVSGGLTTRRSLPQDQHRKALGTLSPSVSHPLLCKDSFTRRGLSPVFSHNALASEAMGRAGEELSLDVAEAVVQHESYRRAALDFVMELAGPHLPSPAAKHVPRKSQLIKPDELPIPAFSIDRDACVTMWNQQLSALSGWEKEDMVKGLISLSSIFQADSKSGTWNRGCSGLMRSVLFGMGSPESSPFLLRRKPVVSQMTERGGVLDSSIGKPPRQSRSRSIWEFPASGPAGCVPVELRFSRRTDSVGAVTGVLCVVAPVAEAAPLSCENCRIGATKNVEVSLWRGEGEGLVEKTPEKKQQAQLANGAIFEECTSSTSSSCSGGGDPAPTASTLSISNSPIVQNIPPPLLGVASVLGPTADASAGATGAEEVRALVMEPVDAVRMELTQNLERCGVEVASCGTLGEAVWRFERSLSDPVEGPKFDVIFLELEPHSDELFLAIRDLRRLEEEAKIMGQLPTLAQQAGFVAPCRPEIKDETTLLVSSISEADVESSTQEGSQVDVRGGSCDVVSSAQKLDESEPDSVQGTSGGIEGEGTEQAVQEAEKRCMILAVVNLNRWDLAGLDEAMEQCVRSGGDAVIPRSMPLQQLKMALRKLGIKSKHLSFPSRLPRALSGSLHNPLNLSR